MWFSFPPGCDVISVECQTFRVELTDETGVNYFRAPDHFANKILSSGGFKLIQHPPSGAPADLPQADPLRDGTIVELTKMVQALERELKTLREDHNSALAKANSLAGDKATLEGQLAKANAAVEELKEQLEDAPVSRFAPSPAKPSIPVLVKGR